MTKFSGLGLNLGNLSRLSKAKSRSISPENFTGEKGKGGMSVDGPAAHMGAKAVVDALADAGLSYADIEQRYVGYVYGDSTSGQAAVYRAGLTGIPIFNVNNNCSTGSTALFLARQAVASGAADCVLALGFEQMAPGAIGDVYSDRPSPLARFLKMANEHSDVEDAPMTIKLFGGAGREPTALAAINLDGSIEPLG